MLSKTSTVWALVLAVVGLGTWIAAAPAAWGQDSLELLYIFTGEAGGDGLGNSVSGAGDVNNDGFDDLIVGAPYNDAGGTNAGRAYVYSGETGNLLWTFTGEAAGDEFGTSVSGAGDVNNDGLGDLIVGAQHNDAGAPNAGRAYVYSGQTGTLLWTFTGGAAGDELGSSVSGAGAVNNDGWDELSVGAPEAFGPYPGRATVYSGQTGGLLWTLGGDGEAQGMGYSVSGAGDVNADGYDDVIVGAPLGWPLSLPGMAYVYSGQTGALLWTFICETEYFFGWSVSGAGDVNNDGHDDLIVGAFNAASGAGRAYVYSGQTGALVWTFTGEAEYDNLGWSVSGAGDQNGDGYDDLIVGAPGVYTGGSFAGRAYVYSGQTGAVLHTFTGEAAGDWLGWSVSGAGDVNNDGFDELIIGAPHNDGGGTDAGRAYVCTGPRVRGVWIDTVSDVGNDQGKQVEICWSSFPGNDPLVTHFTIFRRADSLLFASTGPELDVLSSKDYPPGNWNMVATYPAYGETLYSAVVPTLKDSSITEGMYWSVFFVRAGTNNPTLYFDSPVDSGYSLDNLSPSPPGGLIASHEPAGIVLGWTGTDAADFDYYAIYRDTLSGFDPDASNRLGYAIDTTFTDFAAPLGRTLYYMVSATDFSGNESDPSGEASAARYIAGDANADGIINVADIVYLVNYLYRGGSEPSPAESGDATCDGIVNVADVVFLVNYLYRGGVPPAC